MYDVLQSKGKLKVHALLQDRMLKSTPQQRHHQRQNFFNNIFLQCMILDYMHVFARYSLKLTFR